MPCFLCHHKSSSTPLVFDISLVISLVRNKVLALRKRVRRPGQRISGGHSSLLFVLKSSSLGKPFLCVDSPIRCPIHGPSRRDDARRGPNYTSEPGSTKITYAVCRPRPHIWPAGSRDSSTLSLPHCVTCDVGRYQCHDHMQRDRLNAPKVGVGTSEHLQKFITSSLILTRFEGSKTRFEVGPLSEPVFPRLRPLCSFLISHVQ